MTFRSLAQKKIPSAYDNSYVWQDCFEEEKKDFELESCLGFSQGTLAVLRRALSLGLPRGRVWDLKGVENKAPFVTAASYYKRGVSTSCPETKPLKDSFKASVEYCSAKELREKIQQDSFVVCDSNVPLNGVESDFVFENPSEQNKSLKTVGSLLRAFRENPRPSIVAFGGGVTLDVAAFAASLLQKPITLVPTTFLSMVDASLGGKTGVNFWPYGKNLVGSIYFAEKMLVCPEFIDSLDSRQIRSGGAEALKHALIKGDFRLLTELALALASLDLNRLKEYILQLTQIKKEIVTEDPYEESYRMVLNLGHTLAHGIEALSAQNKNEQIIHGEAVALGLVFITILSRELKKISEEEHKAILKQLSASHCVIDEKAFKKYTGHTPQHKQTWLALQSYLVQDKKQSRQECGSHEWILLQSGGFKKGSSDYRIRVAADIAEKTWNKMWNTLGDQ